MFVSRPISETHTSRSLDESGSSDTHRNPSFVLMSLVPICPVFLSESETEGGRLMVIRRVAILVEECVIVVCVLDVFQSPDSHGYVVSRDGMSSCTIKSIAVF